MERKVIQKFVALILGLTAILVLSVVISAEELRIDDKEKIFGQEQGDKQKNIPQVLLPTNTENIFDFIMDPQQLISMTNAAAYDGRKFEKNATLFFMRSDESRKEDYSSASDAIKIANHGNIAVEIVLTAQISSLGDITMTDDKAFKNDSKTSLYLALTDGKHTVPIDAVNGAVMRTTVPVAGDGLNEYSFWLIGATNKKGNWSEVKDASPKVTVTWKVLILEEDENILCDREEKDILNREEDTLDGSGISDGSGVSEIFDMPDDFPDISSTEPNCF